MLAWTSTHEILETRDSWDPHQHQRVQSTYRRVMCRALLAQP